MSRPLDPETKAILDEYADGLDYDVARRALIRWGWGEKAADAMLERNLKECDVCLAMVPELSFSVTYGIDTYACPKCRGEPERAG